MSSKKGSKGSPMFDPSDLQRGLKGLREAEEDFKSSSKDEDIEAEEAMRIRDHLEDMYDRHDGDLEAIFDELGENPGKALKYPPRDAKHFAEKYSQGGYTYLPGKTSSSRK